MMVTISLAPAVALRKESVDRNSQFGVVFRVNGKVALRKESVDRNFKVWAICNRL